MNFREMMDDFNHNPAAKESREKLFHKCQQHVNVEGLWLSEAAYQTIETLERRLDDLYARHVNARGHTDVGK